MKDIAPAEIEEIDVTIKLANRDNISLIGIFRDVGKNTLLLFLFLVRHKMTFVPICLVDPS